LNRSTQSSQRRENVAAIVFGNTRTKFPQRFFGGIWGNKEETQALHTYSFLQHSSRRGVSRILTGVLARQDTRNIFFPALSLSNGLRVLRELLFKLPLSPALRSPDSSGGRDEAGISANQCRLVVKSFFWEVLVGNRKDSPEVGTGGESPCATGCSYANQRDTLLSITRKRAN